MKHVDLSKSVMDRIVTWEEARTRRWLWYFRIVAVTLLVGFLIFFWYIVTVLAERRTLELLTLFQQDTEIIQEFWQDTVAIFFEELPVRGLVIACLAGFFVFLLFVGTRNRRRIIRRKRQELAKIKRNNENR